MNRVQVSAPSRERDWSRSMPPSGKAAIGRQREDVGNAGGQIPARTTTPPTAAGVEVLLTSAAEIEEGSAPLWSPDDGFFPQMLFVISSRPQCSTGPRRRWSKLRAP